MLVRKYNMHNLISYRPRTAFFPSETWFNLSLYSTSNVLGSTVSSFITIKSFVRPNLPSPESPGSSYDFSQTCATQANSRWSAS